MQRMFWRTAVPFTCLVALAACSQDDAPTSDTGIDAEDTTSDADVSDSSDTSFASCGDGVIDAPYEQCEPSLAVSCADAGFAFGVAQCMDDCRLDTSFCNGVPVCGDDLVEGSEECDPGSTDGGLCGEECFLQTCGDGVVDRGAAGEQCDGDTSIVCEGGGLGVQRCADDCTLGVSTCPSLGVCGDGELNAGEACDDGNLDDGDGCDATCVPSLCGDGVLQSGELCDGNMLADQTCASLGFDAGTLYCTDACRLDVERCEIATCGNGRVESTEGCDDGNRTSADGCSRSCTVEFCGDGRVSPALGEQCDGLDVSGRTCADFGFALAPLECSASCTFDVTGCQPLPLCGDGVVDAELGESCDDGNNINDDGCSAGCLLESCGDGAVQAGEACEPGIAVVTTCVDRGFVSGTVACSQACELDETTCLSSTCGDGVLDADEACDGAQSRSACMDEGFDFGPLDCSESCELDTSRCRSLAMCGDGLRAGAEECDDGNAVDGDGCSLDCVLEYCGDGLVQGALGEECDGDVTIVTGACGADGSQLGTVSCNLATCSYEPTVCPSVECGNAVLDRGEACDDGNRYNGDGCDSGCRSETCGDGTLQDYEACDGNTDRTCADVGAGQGVATCLDCAADYTLCGPDPVCGNGIIERSEDCDDGAANADTADSCRLDCSAPRCGDGIVDAAETCDDPDDDECPVGCAPGFFVVPDDGTINDAFVSGAVHTILLNGPISVGRFDVPHDIVIRGISDDAQIGGLRLDTGDSRSSLTLEDLEMTDAWIFSRGDLTLRNVSFTGGRGNCVRHYEGELWVEDSTFIDCHNNVPSGGAITSTVERTTIIGSTFSGCYVDRAGASGRGGAISIASAFVDTVVTLSDVLVDDSYVTGTSSARGGAIDIRVNNGPGIVTLSDMVVSNNRIEVPGPSATSALGAGIVIEATASVDVVLADLWVNHNTINMTGGNECAGAGVYLTTTSDADVRISDFEIAFNEIDCDAAQVRGAGFYYLADARTTISAERGLVLSNNTTGLGSMGGGLFAQAGSSSLALNLQNVTIARNGDDSPVDAGGAISVIAEAGATATINVTNTTMADNAASVSGGALHTQGQVDVHLNATVLYANSSGCDLNGRPLFESVDNVSTSLDCEFDAGTNTLDAGFDGLQSLDNNGSALRTLLPADGGAAHDATGMACVSIYPDAGVVVEDQRGRPRDDSSCDLGAAER